MKSSDNQSLADIARKRKRIIYVDDVNYSSMSVKSRLAKYYDIFPAESSYKLFVFLENFQPDLILLDVNMPDVDSYETIKNLKADERFADIPVIKALPKHKETPIIIITTESTQEHVNKAISPGASDFIVKPFKPNELNSKTAKHIRISNEMRRLREENEKLYG